MTQYETATTLPKYLKVSTAYEDKHLVSICTPCSSIRLSNSISFLVPRKHMCRTARRQQLGSLCTVLQCLVVDHDGLLPKESYFVVGKRVKPLADTDASGFQFAALQITFSGGYQAVIEQNLLNCPPSPFALILPKNWFGNHNRHTVGELLWVSNVNHCK
jgi:hypothetical protein